MRDYQFGDWLSSLRISNGYSQFQLGKLLGVSDKAVSKWETGAAKPRTAACAKLATIFGISLDDLMSCRQPKEGNRMYSKQSESEEALWQEARDKLRRIYGDDLPLAFQSRLDAEEMLMRGTGMIRHLKLLGSLWEKGTIGSAPCDQKTSLTAWLMNATFINPLQPHTVCPKCHKTVLHREVKDGWDLPEEACKCGTALFRDGHDIRLDVCEKQFAEMDRSVDVYLPQNDEDILRSLISEQYDDTWSLIEYQPPQGEKSIWSFMTENRRYLALIPANAHIPFPLVNNVYQVTDHQFTGKIVHVPEAVIYFHIDAEDDDIEAEENDAAKEKPPHFSIHELIKPDILELARMHIDTVPPLIVETNGRYTAFYLVNFHRDGFSVQYQFDEEKITPHLPEQLKFSTVMQCILLSSGWVWHGFIGNAVKQKVASLPDFPSSQEELFETVKQKLVETGIPDKGIALKLLSTLQKRGGASFHTVMIISNKNQQVLSSEMLHALKSLGFEDWFISYLDFVVRYGLDHKEQLIFDAYSLLYNIAYRKQNGIAEAEFMKHSKKHNDDDSVKEISISPHYIMWDGIRDKIESLEEDP